MTALFERDGDLFVPSELCRGGWDDRHQHGSPPAGLLAWATEQVATAQRMQVVAFHVSLFRPVPLTPLRVETHVVRDGRRIQVVDVALFSGDLQIGRSSALKIRSTDLDLPPHLGTPSEMPAGPDGLAPLDWDPNDDRDEVTRFHVHGVEIRSFDDSFASYGPGKSWFRLRQPLLEGEPLTPFVRLATISDLSNGNAQRLDVRQWTYINADISLYAHRMPVGEWVGMTSHADQHGSGIGVVSTVVYDVDGPIGTISQAQLIDAR
ncbi:MAG: thioesterase family protein [Acidimicrobiia bacterium]|nr:thioesterase family protein [Acidimicrobiia bacterium]